MKTRNSQSGLQDRDIAFKVSLETADLESVATCLQLFFWKFAPMRVDGRKHSKPGRSRREPAARLNKACAS